ncbi:MAG: NAD-dependent succinate-semialdehyde dehydrogenase [Pseudorhodoplanes sp.]|nr:Alpha-ketoglutaric semialdehyde dehydrogenase [Pseudorhodoplanes sp.]MBW7948315.1 NAD-dependent succinate-semialdehyde dehydrogenase [Pseudorhodoplanes sp.]MCL4712483.1 NAD-dependent succinate-semialdehyde dehydrogenase [Pseudorhodoplanes sp.]MCQ3943598.1 NAD-dependent succinate-semialdehyde dehydrogenase [Alphaproteobacteria bacterium]GIK81097.1 MAG: NAD-dependent succinate-semialdehyde dehydrogenase [Alphaproteobacteria bacterium]
MYTDLQLFIDGEWIKGGGRKSEDVINPATEKPLAQLPHAGKADLDHALDAARRGFATWRAMSAYDRCAIMRKAANLMRERHDHISKVLVQEQGKSYAEARAETLVSADIIDWYAEEGRRSYGRIVPGRARGTRQLVVQEPVGIVAAFTPWNFPVLTPARKLGGALGAGCAIIMKASEETPGACIEMVRCFVDAGLPKGVINLVFGVPAEVSEHLLAKDAVRKISFTGSIPVGKHLAVLAAKGMKRTTMELGGHSPVVVFGDADPEKAADTIAAFKYRNAGQVCISPTRFYVQEDVYRKFLDRFTEYAKAIKVGDGLEKGITMGPLANSRRLDAMDSFVADAKQRGGKIVTGGSRRGNQGYFYEPTVITDLPDDARIMTEEPFGPLAPIVTFKTFDEVVERANSLPFGLAAYAFTSSNATAAAIGDAIESGMVGVNSIAISTPETPFGGVKESGHGSEGGIEGLSAYLNTKFISQG